MAGEAPQAMLDRALALVSRGLSVFPLQPRGKRPEIKWERYQHERATEAQVRAWWKAKPNANIAVATGPASGVFVLDVDGERGAATLTALQANHGALPLTWRSVTGKGEHWWFRSPDPPIGNSARKLGDGLDTRGLGGYVVAPGSIHPDGPVYRWHDDSAPELADAPAWLLELLKPALPTPRGPAPSVSEISDRYVARAVEGEIGRVMRASEGSRNDTLNKAAFALGQFVGANALNEGEAQSLLTRAGAAVGLGPREVANTVASGLGDGKLEPRKIPEPERRTHKTNGRQPPPHDPDTGEVYDDAKAAATPDADPEDDIPALYSEISLAMRFSTAHGDKARYVAEWGKWFLYRDGCWREDRTLKVWRWAKKISQSASHEIEEMQPKNKTAAKSIASAKSVAAILTLARSDKRHAAETVQWDKDQWLLNTPSGVADLRTGKILEHDPDLHLSKMTAVAPAVFVPADCVWLQCLATWCGGDAELVAFLQRAAGYSLTGSIKDECFFFLYGLGQNGKTKFLEAITGCIGDYYEAASVDTFIAQKFEKHSADLARLRGARLVSATETEEGRRWAESKIKAITGGDPITAQFMRQDYFTFKPSLKLWIAGNHKPGLKNVDKAMRRRVNIVPFTVIIPEADRDRELSAKLRAEWPVILRWMLDGCRDWQAGGLQPPAAVTSATDDYIEAEDTLGRWLEECCAVHKTLAATFADLWASWKAWAEQAGEYVGNKKRFSQMLSDRGFESQPFAGNVKGFRGLCADRNQSLEL